MENHANRRKKNSRTASLDWEMPEHYVMRRAGGREERDSCVNCENGIRLRVRRTSGESAREYRFLSCGYANVIDDFEERR